MFTRILGTGAYLPEQVRTNFDLEKMVETSDEWIVERTGIRERRIATEEETASFMGAAAARQAIENANLKATDIDAVICATTSGKYAFPSSACEICRSLGISNVPAFDVAAACAGFSYAYAVAHSMILTGQAKNVLIVGSDRMSHACDPADRTTIILFGDGAGAFVLGSSDIEGTMAVHLASDPNFADLLKLQIPPRSGVGENNSYLIMKGNEVFRHAVTILSKLVTQVLEKAQVSADDLDYLVPHQANLRIIAATARKLKLDMSQVVVTLDKQGNTSSASIPLAMHQGISEGKIKRGDLCLLESFGGGFAWGAALVKY